MTTRRSFLKSAAIAPIAAGLVAQPVAAVAETIAESAPIAAEKHPWLWYVSHDEETYYEGFKTLAEAVEYAKDSEYRYVAECCQTDYFMSMDGDEIIEALQGHNEDLMGEDYEFIDATNEQVRDLGVMVTAAIEAWVKKHSINITARNFGGIRNTKIIPLPDDAPSVASAHG